MLIFLSGMNEIATLVEEVKTYSQQTRKWIVLPLHSALSIEEQDRVGVVTDHVTSHVMSHDLHVTSTYTGV